MTVTSINILEQITIFHYKHVHVMKSVFFLYYKLFKIGDNCYI